MTVPATHPDLLVEPLGNGWTRVQLNRPKSLHALDEGLCRALREVFDALAVDDHTQAIWMDSSTSKSFCAGGDVRRLREQVLAGHPEQADAFFEQEYALDLQLHQYPKPLVVWGEGYIMGGGMGLFMAAPFRLVTPESRLAMPEINIGLYPDVGATRFLAERGTLGLFLAMTGSIMGASGAFTIGWATHIAGVGRDEVLRHLIGIDWTAHPAGAFRAIDDTLDALHRPLSSGPLQDSLDVIHSVCRGEDFMADYRAILALRDARSDWLRQAGENLRQGSPMTAAVSWLLWQWGRALPSWEAVFALEQQVASWTIRQPDFVEGVRARLVDKDLQPRWSCQAVNSLMSALPNAPVAADPSWRHVLQQHGVN